MRADPTLTGHGLRPAPGPRSNRMCARVRAVACPRLQHRLRSRRHKGPSRSMHSTVHTPAGSNAMHARLLSHRSTSETDPRPYPCQRMPHYSPSFSHHTHSQALVAPSLTRPKHTCPRRLPAQQHLARHYHLLLRASCPLRQSDLSARHLSPPPLKKKLKADHRHDAHDHRHHGRDPPRAPIPLGVRWLRFDSAPCIRAAKSA